MTAPAKPTAPISVIIPCFQCASTIERAVNSVLNQTQQAREIWLVDDASGDNTLDMLYRLERLHSPIIKVIALNKNVGPGLARNAAWDKATEPWIAFLDADDAWHPQKLEIQWDWIQKHETEVDLCCHATRLITNDAFINPITASLSYQRLKFLSMLISNSIPTRSVILRRELTFRFPNQRFAEDFLLWMRILGAGYKAWRIDASLACCFRPEFSQGGLSGNLWKHEKCELSALRKLHQERLINLSVFILAYSWSLIKFIRRYTLNRMRKS